MNLDFSTLYALWATDFFQKNEILLLCFGVIILLSLQSLKLSDYLIF